MFSLYKTFPGHFMTETSGERHFAFYLLQSFILPLHSDWIILCPYGWQIILFYNNSMNFPFCHLRQSEFLFVDNLFR